MLILPSISYTPVSETMALPYPGNFSDLLGEAQAIPWIPAFPVGLMAK
jgi:hypothetical protein